MGIYPETTPMPGASLITYSTCVTVPPKTGCTDCYPILICSECTSTSPNTLPSKGTQSSCPTCPICPTDPPTSKPTTAPTTTTVTTTYTISPSMPDTIAPYIMMN